MDKLIFSYNWNNKLSCDYFTTLRLHNKVMYYTGNVFSVHLKKGRDIPRVCDAVVIKVLVLNFNQINEYIAGLDTGLNVKECKELIMKLYDNSDIDWSTQWLNFVLLKKIEEL